MYFFYLVDTVYSKTIQLVLNLAILYCMKNESSDTRALNVLNALDEVLAKNLWNESNFLKIIQKNLQDIRNEFAATVEVKEENLLLETKIENQYKDLKEIYISLYSSDGGQLSSWERIIMNLPRQLISRPIYAAEEDIKYLIRSKINKVNEGYVAVYISEKDILETAADKILKDKFGKALLNLKDKALDLNKISRFVHASGEYAVQKGRLVKKGSSD